MEQNKYLLLARKAREEDNTEDAKKFYDMVRIDDPLNVEAKYYFAKYNVEDAINREVPNKFSDYLKHAVSCIGLLKEGTLTEEEQKALLLEIGPDFLETTQSLTNYIANKSFGDSAIYDSDDRQYAQRSGRDALVDFGKKIMAQYPDDENIKKVAVDLFKRAINYPFEYLNTLKDENEKNEFISKIKEVDPNYEPPKAAGGCGKK